VRILNPATEKELADVEEDTPATVARKYTAARAAQPAWAAETLAERLLVLGRFRRAVAERRDDLAAVLTSETGKPITQARNELDGVLPRLDFFLEQTAPTIARQRVLDDDAVDEDISYEPLGVIANISAWNYPWFVGTNVFVPALLTGNAVLYKPSEHATLTGLAIADLLHEAGVPEDVFAAVVGAGPVGADVTGQPVDGIFFTGSYATGRRIAEAVAGRLIRLQLELGGKDPVYVTDDVDVKVAAESLADGAFYNNGQSCCSVERIYVHRAVYEPFIDRFVEVVQGFAIGDPTDEHTYLGPLTRSQQVDVLAHQVEDARHKGASVMTGGQALAGPGAWFAPTVVVDTTGEMDVMRAESFGPIIGIQPVDSDAEAVECMNATEYGLTAGVYTRDEARAEAILAPLDAGSVYWNCCDRVSPRLPWSGRRHSGIGSTLSTLGILTFVQPKAWHLRRP
jgi:acyl-CoA reductase-like NAD-dependent aldehyde dehydrogenase